MTRSGGTIHHHAVVHEGNAIGDLAAEAHLGTTSIYLQGIDPEEVIASVHMRRAPMMSASAGLRL
jgi:hypothetical protein